MKQVLNLKNSQQLSLTPQLQQSLKLLQLSAVDLEHEIQQALDTNPLLDRDEKQLAADVEPNNSTIIAARDEQRLDSPTTIDWQPTLEPRNQHTTAAGQSVNTHNDEFTQIAAAPITLFEHLSSQLQLTALTKRDKLIGNTLLRSLDENGYINSGLNELKTLFAPHFNVRESEINTVLSFIKTLDPIGIGACDLQHRLLILLDHQAKTPQHDLAKRILRDHLPLLATHKYAELGKELNCNEESLAEAIELITTLNPRITIPFSSDKQNHITPDIIIKKRGSKWSAYLNHRNQTTLKTNQAYAKLLKTNLTKADSDYIHQQLSQAKLFIKSLNSRYDTLLLVAKAIVERQQAFFEDGEEKMQPLVLQDIATQLELHESTISRATVGKYLMSPRGTFELKYFFASAINNDDGSRVSSTTIRHLIKQIVSTEAKHQPLSDSKITAELANQGHKVARRTVAKYRESLKIPPASQRKMLLTPKSLDSSYDC